MKPVKSEMAGTVIEIQVKVGDSVSADQTVAIIESMKMEVPLASSESGKVTKICKEAGDFVNEGETVFELE